MIYWENRDWQSGGFAERLTLWQDGGSELSRTQRFDPSASEQLKPEWKVRGTPGHLVYYRLNPLPKAEAKRRFGAALSAGMQGLRSFTPGYYDGSGTRIGIKTDGRLKQVDIPLFIMPGATDNQGSENYRRFGMVKLAFGDFHASPFVLSIAPEKITVISMDHFIPAQKRTEHFVLDKLGSSTVSIDMPCIAPDHIAPNWTAGGKGEHCIYAHNNMLRASEAQQRFNAVIEADILTLQPTLKPLAGADAVTLTVRTGDWQDRKITISTDAKQNQPQNFAHFMAVQNAFGHFNTQVEKAAP
jgi:hypothetical protein